MPPTKQLSAPRRALYCVAWLVVLVCHPSASWADESSDPARLVQQLGSSSFEERERATERLAELGAASRAALEEGLKNRDAEIRNRCRRLLAEVNELAYRHELDAFEADPAGKKDFRLPGWEPFKQRFGDDRVAREIFVAMYRAEPELMRSLDGDGQETSQRIDDRIYDLSTTPTKQLSYQSLAALMFAALQPNVAASPDAISAMQNQATHPPLRLAAASGPRSEVVRKLLEQWIQATATGPHAPGGVTVSMFHNLKMGVKPAQEVLAQPKISPYYLCLAALCLARFGDKSHLPILEGLLDNQAATQFAVPNQQVVVQVRDVALAALLHLTGQDVKSYGFSMAERDATYLYAISSLHFADDDARQAAFQKWKYWKSANSDKLK